MALQPHDEAQKDQQHRKAGNVESFDKGFCQRAGIHQGIETEDLASHHGNIFPMVQGIDGVQNEHVVGTVSFRIQNNTGHRLSSGFPEGRRMFVNIKAYTGGNLIFEEQISVLLHTVTGWNLERSEKVRRDLKKGRGEQHEEEFFKKGKANGWKEADLQTFWKLAGDFSRYAFNQGHSVSYAYSAYLSAWFKTHHPVTFFGV